MKKSIHKRKILVASAIVVFGILSVCAGRLYYDFQEARVVTTVSHLGDIRDAYIRLQNSKPDLVIQNLDQLNVMSEVQIDLVNEEKFRIYTSEESKEILLSQPHPYRTDLWPWGELRQYGILRNGNLLNIRKLPVAYELAD